MIRCLKPRLLKTNVVVDKTTKMRKYMYVDCGKCLNCLKKKRNQMTGRLLCELETCTFGQFLTLTYDDLHIYKNSKGIPSVNKRELQLFLKRFRKQCDKLELHLRYFAVGEYGGTFERPHYHVLCYYYYLGDGNMTSSRLDKLKMLTSKAVSRCWLNSINKPVVSDLNHARCHYSTKDILKSYSDVNAPNGAENTFFLMSRRPGLGAFYLSESILKSLYRLDTSDSSNMNIITLNGESYPLSRYFRRKYKDAYHYDFTIDDYYKLVDSERDDNDKRYRFARDDYMSKHPNATEIEFIEYYFKDVSDELLRLHKYKSKVVHSIKK